MTIQSGPHIWCRTLRRELECSRNVHKLRIALVDPLRHRHEPVGTSGPSRSMLAIRLHLSRETRQAFGEGKAKCENPHVALRTCRISCFDASGVEHAVEVTARSLYEAVARGLHILRQNDWVDGIHQNSTITIAVKEPVNPAAPRGTYRVIIRHCVSRVRSGQRQTLGIIRDAR